MMLSSRPGKALQEWPDSAASIGGAIFTSRIGRRQAWRACGPARAKFEQEIQPLLHSILERGDLDYADFLIKVYMIGRRPDSATPIILICCMNQKAREGAQEIVQDSGLLGKYPGFGLGISALPLEDCNKLERFAGVHEEVEIGLVSNNLAKPVLIFQANNPITSAYTPRSQIIPRGTYNALEHDLISTKVLAATALPKVGRQLYIRPTDRIEILHQATGGVVLQVGGFYCQLTVHHLYIRNLDPVLDEVDSRNLDVCSFDRQDDIDDLNIHDTVAEYEITSRGSLTPQSITSLSDEESMGGSFIFDDIVHRLHNSALRGIEISDDKAHQNAIELPMDEVVGLDLKSIGRIFGHAHSESSAFFDYALVQVTKNEVHRLGRQLNRIDTPRSLRIRRIAEIGSTEARIIAVMSSSDLVPGILFPDRISYRRHGTLAYQKIYQVKLDQAPIKGDCGSAVVDKETGDLYGHIVLGDVSAKIAYIVPATEVIPDIPRALGFPARLPSLPSQSMSTHSSRSSSQARSTIDDNLSELFSFPSHFASMDRSICQDSEPNPILQVILDFEATARHQATTSHQRGQERTQQYDSSCATSTAWPEDQPCLEPRFGYLPCDFVGWNLCESEFPLDATQHWIDHIKDHLHGQFPEVALCWFCDEVFDAKLVDDCETNFDARMLHIRDHIINEQLNADDIRPDWIYADHLFDHGLLRSDVLHYARRGRDVIQFPYGMGPVPHVRNIYTPDYIPEHRRAQQDRDSQVIVDTAKEERHHRRHHRERHGEGRNRHRGH